MNIRTKLAWTLTTILIVTVTAGSTYAVFYVRGYLLDRAVQGMEKDAYWMMHTLGFLPDGPILQDEIERLGEATGYHIALYDTSGTLLASWPPEVQRSPHLHLHADDIALLKSRKETMRTINTPGMEELWIYASILQVNHSAGFFVISQSRSRIFEPVHAIRRIIYTGLAFSILIILTFSVLLAHYMAGPLLSLTRNVERIAAGDTGHVIRVRRSDEIGRLAHSVNKMALKLRSDYEQLQKSNEKQRQFFADITHEVRNPLHTIMGSLEMMELPGLSDEKRKKYVRNLRNQAERISRLFKDLMTLQRFDSDDNFVIRQHVNMADISGNVAEYYRQKARGKGIELKIDTHPCWVYADAVKIEQVLDNLVSNAVKFTSKGTISVTYRRLNGKVEVAVRDTGIGIPEAHWNRLFDRFYRTDKARSRDKGGTGLGLSVVKSILDAHKSEIQLESEVGRGSVFYFFLRSSSSDSSAPPESFAEEDAGTSTRLS